MTSWSWFSKQEDPIPITTSFKTKTFEQRQQEAQRIREKYPYHVPCICEKSDEATMKEMGRKKFLIPQDLTFVAFLSVIRKKNNLRPEKAIFLFIDKSVIPSATSTFGELYTQYRDRDGFLYLTYTDEMTFGAEV